MFKHPNNPQVGDKVAIFKWNTSGSKKVIFCSVAEVSTRKITVKLADGEQMSFKTSDWRLWDKEKRRQSSIELVDETTGLNLQRQIDEEAVCKAVARDVIEIIGKFDFEQFSRYLCYSTVLSRVKLKNDLETRKQGMQDAIFAFDKMIATLEGM